MVTQTRGTTAGNRRVDVAQLRQDLTKINPVVAQTMRNAVPRNGRNPETNELNDGERTVSQFKLERLSNIISNNINAATDLRVITPYIDKADLIWKTILLYPNGKQAKILTYDTLPSPTKNAKLHGELIGIWDNYYTNGYKIEKDLKKIVSDILINTGSYTLFNLSRPGLDYLINGSEVKDVAGNESFKYNAKAFYDEEFTQVGNKTVVKNKGVFIRDPDDTANMSVGGMESIFGTPKAYSSNEINLFGKEDPEGITGITITDNPAALYLQKFGEMERRRGVQTVSGVESLGGLVSSVLKSNSENKQSGNQYVGPNDIGGKDKPKGKKAPAPQATTLNLTTKEAAEVSSKLFPNRNINSQSIQFVKQNEALGVSPYGRGITWHVPSEAVIPIHINGSNGTKTDFIFLTDPSDGSFLKNTADFEFYQSGKKNADSITNKNKNGSGNSLIANLKNIQEGKDCDFDMSEFADMAKSNLIRRFMQLSVSGKSENISVQLDEEVNKIFLQRMFRGQGVRCLYVPGESVTYMALNYNRMGIGQSLTQLAKMHIARLAAMDLADAMANLEAATPHSVMTINVNEKAPEPFADIAIARAAYFEANPRLTNILSTAQLSIPQIVDALRENSLTVKVNAGENPHFPTHEMSVDPMDRNNFKPVDANSRQELLNKISNYLHLSRSWLDVSDDQNNFAIEALAEHQMLLNQVVNWQEELGDFIIDFERKHAQVNTPLMKELIDKILENKSLWKPDSAVPIEGTEEEILTTILTGFLNSLVCNFPTPTSIETTTKIKDSLDVVDGLVEKWMTMAGHSGNLEQIALLLGYGDSSETGDKKVLDDVKAQIKSVFLAEAFRRYNLPSPFDDIVNDGKGGGLASIVNSVVHQRQNIGEFLATMMVGVNDADAKTLKSHSKKIDKAVLALAAVKATLSGEDQENPDLENGPPQPETEDGGDDLEDGGEDGGGDELPETPETGEEEEEETEEKPEEEEETEENDDDQEKGNDGLDPSKNDPGHQPFKA